MSLSPPRTVQAPQAASRACHEPNVAWRASLSESRVREILTHGSVEQTAPVVTPPISTSDSPIIGVTALRRLVDWLDMRRKSAQQGEPSCVSTGHPLLPPRPIQAARPSALNLLWPTLPAESRERILNALGRVVARHIARPPDAREVSHERP